MTNDPMYLPLFVYGTLIAGQPNDHYVAAHVVAQEPAWFAHGRLYTFETFPMLIETAEGQPIHGRLLTLNPATYDAVFQQLDALEEYDPADETNSPYLRRQREVQTADGRTHTAWVYLGQPHFVTFGLPHIPSGDWVQHTAEQANQDSMAAWWQTHGVKLLFGQKGEE